MSEETQTQETVEETVATEETTENIENGEQATEETQETKTEDIDYKAMYESSQARLKKSEGKIQHLKEKNAETESENDATFDTESIAETVREAVSQEVKGIRQELQQDKIANAIKSQAVNDDHAKLVEFHYNNSLNLTGDLEADIENAFALADSKVTKNKLTQAQRANSSKASKGNSSQDAGPAQGDSSTPNTNGLSAGLKKMIADGTYKFNTKTKRYEAPTAKMWFTVDNQGNKSGDGRLD